MVDDTTVVITDIKKALRATDDEANMKPAALLIVGGELNGTIFDLNNKSTTVGRSSKNIIPLEFQGISRDHFKVDEVKEGHTVEDTGSRNGTYINNKRVLSPIVLQKGDIIKVGKLALKYIPQGDPERLTYDKLQHAANTDGLTGCYTKTFFNRALDIQVKKCRLSGDPLSLIMFDLDHFKKLNDNYGHDAGDFVLKNLCSMVKNAGVRDGDIFARFGGEEFMILLPSTNIKQAYDVAERIRALVDQHKFDYDKKILPVSISVGLADYRKGVTSGADLFKRVDLALYKSKDGGRNQVNFYKD